MHAGFPEECLVTGLDTWASGTQLHSLCPQNPGLKTDNNQILILQVIDFMAVTVIAIQFYEKTVAFENTLTQVQDIKYL